MLTETRNKHFSERLFYADSLSLLPQSVAPCRNGNQIVHLYDAAGVKYKSIYFTLLPTASTPYDEIAHYTFNSDTVEYYITEYAGNIENYYSRYDILRRIFNTEGYFERDTLYCYYKDHLGNNVAVRNMMSDSIVQQTVYYASGLPMAQSTSVGKQSYKYNGKEFVEMHGLDEYDSQARWYYPAIVRTTTMDPMAESYYHLSPYAWCGNNPTTKIDTDGQYYFDWGDWCYRSDYGNHDEVHFSEVLFNDFIEPRPIEIIGARCLFKEWILGNGEYHRDFDENDGLTQQFVNNNPRLNGIIKLIADAIANGIESSDDDAESKDGKYDFNLGEQQHKPLIAIHDFLNFCTNGLTGNVAMSVVGSFSTHWKVIGRDNEGNAIVTITASNPMKFHSFSRPPVDQGYGTFYKQKVSPVLDRLFDEGIGPSNYFAAQSQTFTWTITIPETRAKR